MKCKDCKHCAYVNERVGDLTTINSTGTKTNTMSFQGGFCMLSSFMMSDVQECDAYDKRNLKLK